MAGQNTSVYAIFRHRSRLDTAIDDLKRAGFRSSDVSVLSSENEGFKDFAHQKASKAPEGASTGAATGAVVGGTLGWLVGIGSLAIPGVGPLIAAGPIVAALAGGGVGGAVGGVLGGLIGVGIPEYEAKRYEGIVKNGGILVSVHCDDSDWVKRAKEIFVEAGGTDVSSSGESKNVLKGTETSPPYKRMPDLGSEQPLV